MRGKGLDLKAQRKCGNTDSTVWMRYAKIARVEAVDVTFFGIFGEQLGNGQIVMRYDWNEIVAWNQIPL